MTEDNRLIGEGVTRELEYDGDAKAAKLYLGAETVLVHADFTVVHKIVRYFDQRYQEGYRAGLRSARLEIQSLERRHG